MTQKKYPLCLVCNKPYTERKGLRFRHYDQAGVYWHNLAAPVFPTKRGAYGKWIEKMAASEDAAGGFPGVSGAMVRHMKPRLGVLGLPIPAPKPGDVEMDAGDEI